jgi:undecaprenyl-diphosphatase
MKVKSETSHALYEKKERVEGLEEFFNRCNQWEIGFVRAALKISSGSYVRSSSIFINRLSNGWLYPAIILVLLAIEGLAVWRLLLVSGLAAAIAHSIYAVIKGRLARLRPCDYDRALNLSIKTLDKYSCPSGHIMTATVVAVPLGKVFPFLLPAIIVTCLVIAWARISLGHHYPSDILLGALLGSMVSLPVSIFLIN